jgi:hypothetical protein
MSKFDPTTILAKSLAKAVVSQALGEAKPSLIPNWRETIKHAWSFKLDAAGVVLGAAEFGVQAVSSNPPINQGTFAILGMVVTALSMILRLVRQEKVSGAAE